MQQRKHLVVLVTRESIACIVVVVEGKVGNNEKKENISVNPFNDWKRDGMYILRRGTP